MLAIGVALVALAGYVGRYPRARFRPLRGGAGRLGPLAKRFVELHGGRIWLESEVGKGTTFTFALPLERTAPVVR